LVETTVSNFGAVVAGYRDALVEEHFHVWVDADVLD
jgi:hypothetical protein